MIVQKLTWFSCIFFTWSRHGSQERWRSRTRSTGPDLMRFSTVISQLLSRWCKGKSSGRTSPLCNVPAASEIISLDLSSTSLRHEFHSLWKKVTTKYLMFTVWDISVHFFSKARTRYGTFLAQRYSLWISTDSDIVKNCEFLPLHQGALQTNLWHLDLWKMSRKKLQFGLSGVRCGGNATRKL